MRLLRLDFFAPIFEPIAGQHVGLVEAGGNAGDLMIHRATRQLCEAFDVSWALWDPDAYVPEEYREFDRLLIFGGGNMGTPYQGGRDIRLAAVRTGIPCDLLPQTWMHREAFECDRMFVREKTSLALGFAPEKCVLVPDLALGMEFEPHRGIAPRFDVEYFMRIDSESLFPTWPAHDPTRYALTIEDYLHLASQYGHIFTDRLHFAIAGLMEGRRVTLMPNAYHKNRSMWLTWLADLGCEFWDPRVAPID